MQIIGTYPKNANSYFQGNAQDLTLGKIMDDILEPTGIQ